MILNWHIHYSVIYTSIKRPKNWTSTSYSVTYIPPGALDAELVKRSGKKRLKNLGLAGIHDKLRVNLIN